MYYFNFDFGIVSHENTRLKKTQEDRDRLKQMKEDIFNEDIPITNIIEKIFKYTNHIT